MRKRDSRSKETRDIESDHRDQSILGPTRVPWELRSKPNGFHGVFLFLRQNGKENRSGPAQILPSGSVSFLTSEVKFDVWAYDPINQICRFGRILCFLFSALLYIYSCLYLICSDTSIQLSQPLHTASSPPLSSAQALGLCQICTASFFHSYLMFGSEPYHFVLGWVANLPH